MSLLSHRKYLKWLTIPQWFIEFEQEPENWSTFAEAIDNEMRKQNIYYDDLIVGNILKKSSYYGWLKMVWTT
jgi:hypothetical protein